MCFGDREMSRFAALLLVVELPLHGVVEQAFR